MYLTTYRIWCVTFFISLVLSASLPDYRIYFIALSISHVAVFIAGIFNIRMQFFVRTYYHAPAATGSIALTFDDGPDHSLTIDILEVLKKFAVTATFFVVGDNARQHPDIVKRCFEDGHTIACHDLGHSNLSNFRTTRLQIRDIGSGLDIIQEIIGKRPLLYRPPVGLTNPHTPKALERLHLKCIGWSIRAGENGNRSLINIRKIHTLVKPGSVVLLHDCLPNPAYKQEILHQIEWLCENIKHEGLNTVGVAELFGLRVYEDVH